MSKNVLVNLNMNGNEIQNVVMQVLATAPSNPKTGQYYYNSASKKAFQWDGSAWKPLGGAEITIDSVLSSTSTNPVQNKAINSALGNKVDKVSGKGLSTNDYTTDEKNKLAGIASGANKTTVDSALSSTSENPVQNKVIAASLGGKVDYDEIIISIDNWEYGKEQDFPPSCTVVEEFVSGEISSAIAASDAMIFKGTLGTGGTVTALPTTYKTGWTYRVITAGTYAGNVCEVGDLIIALVDRSGSGNANADWTVAQTNIDGAITSISGTSPVNVSGSGSSRTVSHANSGVTANTYGNTSAQTPVFGGTVNVPYATVNATGHVTAAGTATVKIPDTVATTSAAGLMSATDKTNLNNLYENRLLVAYGSITAGETSCDINVHTECMVVGFHAYMGTDEVVVDMSDDGDGTITASIAQPITTRIDIVLIYTYYWEIV